MKSPSRLAVAVPPRARRHHPSPSPSHITIPIPHHHHHHPTSPSPSPPTSASYLNYIYRCGAVACNKLCLVEARGCRSIGRSLASHARGTGIETRHLHFIFGTNSPRRHTTSARLFSSDIKTHILFRTDSPFMPEWMGILFCTI